MLLLCGETGLPETSFPKAHFIQVLAKGRRVDRLPRILLGARLREVVAIIRGAIDPNAPYGPPHCWQGNLYPAAHALAACGESRVLKGNGFSRAVND